MAKISVAVVGARGIMGRRYVSILRCFDYVTLTEIDIDNKALLRKNYDRIIIATPTATHCDLLNMLHKKAEYILCEKPIDTDADNIPLVYKNCFMVNNWVYVTGTFLKPNAHKIRYKYFNWSANNDAYDAIQPVYLARTLKMSSGPLFLCTIDDTSVTREDFDCSYIAMINEFLGLQQDFKYPGHLWTLNDAYEATIKCGFWDKRNKIYGKNNRWDTGTIQFDKATQ